MMLIMWSRDNTLGTVGLNHAYSFIKSHYQLLLIAPELPCSSVLWGPCLNLYVPETQLSKLYNKENSRIVSIS